MTPGQRRFKAMVLSYPELAVFWSFDRRECDLAAIEKALPSLSHGEQIMLRFFTAVWLGENRFSFDLIEAAKVLDEKEHQVVLQWLPEHKRV